MIRLLKPARRSQRWSDEDIALLRELATTATLAEIATKLGRTRSSVEDRAKGMGLSLRAAPATIASPRWTRKNPPG
jgi:hypothetical protein